MCSSDLSQRLQLFAEALVLSVVAIAWSAVLSAVLASGCQRSAPEAWREGGAPVRHVLAGEAP